MEQEEAVHNQHEEVIMQILKKKPRIEENKEFLEEVNDNQRKHFFLQVSLNLLGENRKVETKEKEEILVLEEEERKTSSRWRFLKLEGEVEEEQEEEEEEEIISDDDDDNLFADITEEEKNKVEDNKGIYRLEQENIFNRVKNKCNKKKTTRQRHTIIEKLRQAKKEERRGESTLVRKTFYNCFKEGLDNHPLERNYDWVEKIRYFCEESILWLTTKQKMRPSSLINKYLEQKQEKKTIDRKKPPQQQQQRQHSLLLQKGFRLLSDHQIEYAIQHYIPKYKHNGFRNLSVITQLFREEINLGGQGYMFRDFNMSQTKQEYNTYYQNYKQYQFNNFYIINNSAIQNTNTHHTPKINNLNLADNLNLNLNLQRVFPTELGFNSTSERKCYHFEPILVTQIRDVCERSHLQDRNLDRENIEKLLLLLYSYDYLDLRTFYWSMLHSGYFTLDDITTIIKVFSQFPEALQILIKS
jgi:hypothetical protein